MPQLLALCAQRHRRRSDHPRKVSVGSSSQDAALQRVKSDLPDEAAAFEAELINIYTQKAAVVKRYQDRLAFLQSKHRSATIREGLK